MEILQGVWKQHLRPRAVVGYGVKIFLPSPPNYVTRSPGKYKNKANRTDLGNLSNCLFLQVSIRDNCLNCPDK